MASDLGVMRFKRPASSKLNPQGVEIHEMKKTLPLIIFGMIFSINAVAYDRGDIAYVCYKKSAWSKWMWVVGNDNEACRVRVLERAGSSYRVEMDDYCSNYGHSKGERFWTNGSDSLFSSKESCEG